MLVYVRPSNEALLRARVPGAQDQGGRPSHPFHRARSASKKGTWLLPSVAETTTARRGMPTPRRTLDASPVAGAVVLTMNGERKCRLAHRLIRKDHAGARGPRCLHLVYRLIVIVLTPQFLFQILAKLLKEVRQILPYFARLHFGLIQGVQDLLSQRPELQRLLRRGTEVRDVSRIRTRRSGR